VADALDLDGAMAGSSEHAGKGLEATFSHGRKPERERGRRRAHQCENRRRKRLGSAGQRAVDRGGAPAVATSSGTRVEVGKRVKWERQGRLGLARGGRNRGREKWERGRGFGLLRSPARERKGRLGKEKKLTDGPACQPLEREEGEGDGRLGRMGLQAESEGGGEGFSFYFFSTHFQKHFQFEF